MKFPSMVDLTSDGFVFTLFEHANELTILFMSSLILIPACKHSILACTSWPSAILL